MKRKHGFTLVEILIVLAIIGILMAILFPVIKRAKEGGNQASCRTNLHQIGLAVALYKNDEKEYPGSLAFLLPADANIGNNAGGTAPNTKGAGWLKSTRNLMCPDDDNDSVIRSSYGDISIVRPATPAYASASYTDPHDPSEMSRYVWNYYGYDANGTAYLDGASVTAAGIAAIPNPSYLYNPLAVYDARANPIKYSMSNRFAPASTIVTHCIFHRTQTSNAADATLTSDDAAHKANAKDIILRLDGAALVVDITNFSTLNSWQNQTD